MPLQATITQSGTWAKGIVVFFSAMVPLIENKGSIILAAALNLKWYIAYLGTTIGTFLPVPFLLRNSRKKLAGLRRFGPIGATMAHVDAFAKKHAAFLHRRGCMALALIISIPFTGIGSWAGVLLADILKLDPKRAAVAIFAGVVVSGFLTTVGVYGLFLGVRQLLHFW
ncbi:MAG: hypothetical protein PWQ08_648 [Clostridiales bacterium]|jgi:uncharacterized membrane protein|nr:hypothetical protein [Clostridiales bacterium]